MKLAIVTPPKISELPFIDPLPAQKVATVAAQLADTEKRQIIWYLHWASHQPGGLTRFAHEMLCEVIPARLGTPTMRAAGVGPGIVYSGETYEKICTEISSYEHPPTMEVEREMDFYLRHPSEFGTRRVPELQKAIKPTHRHATCPVLLQVCMDSCRDLPTQLSKLCLDSRAIWEHSHFVGFYEAVRETIALRVKHAQFRSAPTKIAGYVHDAMSFAYRNKSLAVIHGTERLGKSVATRLWQESNAGRARLIDLTAATTDILFYQELFKALGCGSVKRGDANELRAGIRAAVENRDLMLIFDEAHCLFGLSARASVKRLEYIRTEFVNRGIPVVLVVTPQFSDRLREMERTTGFNTNQFRGRITKWAELPKKPSRADVECVCRFMLPTLDDECAALLVDCAMSADTPLSALHNAVLEARSLGEKEGRDATAPDIVRTAIGYSLATRQMVDASIPAAHQMLKRPRAKFAAAPSVTHNHMPETASAGRIAGSVQPACTRNAKEVPAAVKNRAQNELCVS